MRDESLNARVVQRSQVLDRVAQFESEGTDLVDALVLSGRLRLRPVLMTSMAAALGMLPLALRVGTGAEMLRPLAIAVMGGLAVSVLLALVATPGAYYLRRRIGSRGAVASSSPAPG